MDFSIEEGNGSGCDPLGGEDGLHLPSHAQVGGVRHTVRDNGGLCTQVTRTSVKENEFGAKPSHLAQLPFGSVTLKK